MKYPFWVSSPFLSAYLSPTFYRNDTWRIISFETTLKLQKRFTIHTFLILIDRCLDWYFRTEIVPNGSVINFVISVFFMTFYLHPRHYYLFKDANIAFLTFFIHHEIRFVDSSLDINVVFVLFIFYVLFFSGDHPNSISTRLLFLLILRYVLSIFKSVVQSQSCSTNTSIDLFCKSIYELPSKSWAVCLGC